MHRRELLIDKYILVTDQLTDGLICTARHLSNLIVAVALPNFVATEAFPIAVPWFNEVCTPLISWK